ncbi:hypothetical protein [Priestia megaterium]|uniref:hypothetical protein n=1 Tax=Priestia megaterium TaxID=1404 RepID=UPI001C488456|nr:hypothetical protein [Priestia megaterium]MBV6736568.1 hypothetical protein [Priestia megaterium]
MVDTILYFLFSFCYIVLFFFSIYVVRKNTSPFYMLFLPLVIAGLIYDNIMIGIGSFIGEGDTLRSLSMLRFWFHALFTPTLVLFAYGVAKYSTITWAKKPVAGILFLLTTFALISYETLETISQHMEVVREYGIVRYTLVGSSGPPLMVLIVAIILLFVGISLFRKTRWSSMMIGVAVMLVGSAVSIPIPSTAVTNTFELIFIFSLFLTQRHLMKIH